MRQPLMLIAKRGKAAAVRFFDKAIEASGVPENVTMDKSGANKAAMDEINARGETLIIVRQIKYLNNIIEQDHRAVKRVTKPMLNLKSLRATKCVLAGIELMHMIRKGQLMMEGVQRDVFCRSILCIGRANPSILRKWHSSLPNHVHQWLTLQNRILPTERLKIANSSADTAG